MYGDSIIPRQRTGRQSFPVACTSAAYPGEHATMLTTNTSHAGSSFVMASAKEFVHQLGCVRHLRGAQALMNRQEQQGVGKISARLDHPRLRSCLAEQQGMQHFAEAEQGHAARADQIVPLLALPEQHRESPRYGLTFEVAPQGLELGVHFERAHERFEVAPPLLDHVVEICRLQRALGERSHAPARFGSDVGIGLGCGTPHDRRSVGSLNGARKPRFTSARRTLFCAPSVR
jgi:hypothetical protein